VTQSVTAIVLAAGAGKRMQSELPKPLHLVGGQPMIDWVLNALVDERITSGVVVIGHGGEEIRSHLESTLSNSAKWRFVIQDQQLGTGHATSVALEGVSDLDPESILVLPGDTPLLRSSSISEFLDGHFSNGASLSVLSAVVDAPTGYGRIVHDSKGDFVGIVEERDASDEQRTISEINTGIMVGSALALQSALQRVGRGNAQGEFYLTDVVGILVADGEKVRAEILADSTEAQGVNDPDQLAFCEMVLNQRHSN